NVSHTVGQSVSNSPHDARAALSGLLSADDKWQMHSGGRRSVIGALLPEPAQALEGALEWVDARFGPFHDFYLRRLSPPEPAWWCSTCQLARAPAGALFVEIPAGAGGCSTSPVEARARMLGEALERYSGFHAAND